MRRLAWLFVLAVACGKKPVDPGAIDWIRSAETAEAQALREKKPLLVYVGAEWDSAAKEMEHESFADADVRALSKRYVMLSIDATDDESPSYQRDANHYRVVGTPSLMIYSPDHRTELHRINSFIAPEQLASILTYADAPRSGFGDVGARASYEGLREVIRDLRERALGDPLMDPSRTPPWVNCYGKPKAEEARCLEEDEARRQRWNDEHDRFEHTVLPALLAGSPVLSIELHRGQGQESRWAAAGPRSPKQKLGTRNAEVGVALDATTMLGWGTYRTRHGSQKDARGDDTLHSGIEILDRTNGDYVKMVVLTDGFRRPKDWR